LLYINEKISEAAFTEQPDADPSPSLAPPRRGFYFKLLAKAFLYTAVQAFLSGCIPPWPHGSSFAGALSQFTHWAL